MSHIRVELKFKNAALFNAIKETGMSFPEFSKVSGIGYMHMNSMINFRAFPSERHMEKICSFLGLSKEDLFIKYLPQYRQKCGNTIKWDISENQFKVLRSNTNHKLLSESFKMDLNRVLAILRPYDAKIIKMHFLDEKTFDEIGDELDITRAAAQARASKAMEKLRTSKVKKLLYDYL